MKSGSALATRPPLERFQTIHRILRAGKTDDGDRPNCATLARLLEVSSKTVQRDIDFMRDRLGAPIDYDPDTKSWKYTREDYTFPLSGLSEEDLFALIYGCQVLQKIGVGALGDGLLALVGGVDQANPTGASSLVSFSDAPGAIINPHILRPVVRALLTRRRLDMTYFTIYREAITHRQVDPYHLGRYMGRWFLIGHDYFRNKRRVFAVAQVREARVLDQTFAIPPGFDARDYLGEEGLKSERSAEPIRVVLAFERKAGIVAKELFWHPNQQFQESPDGRIQLTFESRNIPLVLRWVLARGADVEVLSPKELRQEVHKVISAAAGIYGGAHQPAVQPPHHGLPSSKGKKASAETRA